MSVYLKESVNTNNSVLSNDDQMYASLIFPMYYYILNLDIQVSKEYVRLLFVKFTFLKAILK